MAFEPDAGPHFRVQDFDFERDPARLAPMAQLYNAATSTPRTLNRSLAPTCLASPRAVGKWSFITAGVIRW
jgi:feruloyl esterase